MGKSQPPWNTVWLPPAQMDLALGGATDMTIICQRSVYSKKTIEIPGYGDDA